MPTTSVVELQEVWYSYNERVYAIKGVSLAIAHGSATAIVGPSGSGKTTLLKLVNGLLTPTRGSVRVLGNGINGPAHGVRRKVGYIPQQLGLIRNLTALENVMVGALPRLHGVPPLLGLFPPEELRAAREYLELVGLAEKADEKVHRLSGGERQRVAIARVLMQRPLLILADEFTSDLDYATACDILDLMESIRRDGVTLVMVTHNLALAAKYAEQAAVIQGGVKVLECQASELQVAEARLPR